MALYLSCFMIWRAVFTILMLFTMLLWVASTFGKWEIKKSWCLVLIGLIQHMLFWIVHKPHAYITCNVTQSTRFHCETDTYVWSCLGGKNCITQDGWSPNYMNTDCTAICTFDFNIRAFQFACIRSQCINITEK